MRQARQPGLEETFAFDPAGNLMFLPQEASRPALANTAGRDHAHWDQGLAFLEPPAPAVPGPLPPVRHNQLLRYAEGAYRYDARGNVINKLHQAQAGQAPQHLHLHYDLDNRLSRALKPQPGGTLEALYTYDPLGRRVAKQVRSLVPTASASHALQVEQEQLTCFVWDGDLLLQEIADDHTLTHLYEPESFVPYAQVLSPVPATHYDPATVRAEQERLDRQAAEQQTEAETLAWLALTQPAAHAQLQTTLAERDAQRQAQARQQQDEQAAADQVCYLLTDPLGTPQEAYSPDGRCLWQARYKAWGRIFKLDHAAIHQPLRFQGQYHDDETGLHYNRHRYYDPDSGRYLTQDPIGLRGGVNVYSYVPDPTTWIDPYGLSGIIEKGIDLASRAVDKGIDIASHANNIWGKFTGFTDGYEKGKEAAIRDETARCKAEKEALDKVSNGKDINTVRYEKTAKTIGNIATGPVSDGLEIYDNIPMWIGYEYGRYTTDLPSCPELLKEGQENE